MVETRKLDFYDDVKLILNHLPGIKETVTEIRLKISIWIQGKEIAHLYLVLLNIINWILLLQCCW